MERHPHRNREPVGTQPAEYPGLVLGELLHAPVPGEGAGGGTTVLLQRLLGVAGSDLLQMGVMKDGLLVELPPRPDEDALRPYPDVDPRVVPVERGPQRLRRMHLPRGGELLDGFAVVALPIRLQVM